MHFVWCLLPSSLFFGMMHFRYGYIFFFTFSICSPHLFKIPICHIKRICNNGYYAKPLLCIEFSFVYHIHLFLIFFFYCCILDPLSFIDSKIFINFFLIQFMNHNFIIKFVFYFLLLKVVLVNVNGDFITECFFYCV